MRCFSRRSESSGNPNRECSDTERSSSRISRRAVSAHFPLPSPPSSSSSSPVVQCHKGDRWTREVFRSLYCISAIVFFSLHFPLPSLHHLCSGWLFSLGIRIVATPSFTNLFPPFSTVISLDCIESMIKHKSMYREVSHSEPKIIAEEERKRKEAAE